MIKNEDRPCCIRYRSKSSYISRCDVNENDMTITYKCQQRFQWHGMINKEMIKFATTRLSPMVSNCHTHESISTWTVSNNGFHIVPNELHMRHELVVTGTQNLCFKREVRGMRFHTPRQHGIESTEMMCVSTLIKVVEETYTISF